MICHIFGLLDHHLTQAESASSAGRYSLYDFLHENLELVQYGLPLSLQPVVRGAASGAITGLLTNPPDLILSVLLTDQDRHHQDEHNEHRRKCDGSLTDTL